MIYNYLMELIEIDNQITNLIYENNTLKERLNKLEILCETFKEKIADLEEKLVEIADVYEDDDEEDEEDDEEDDDDEDEEDDEEDDDDDNDDDKKVIFSLQS
jgi:hypothetical protein